MAVVRKRIGQHERAAVDVEVNVQVAALVIGRIAERLRGAERLDVEVGRSLPASLTLR